jgi:hypothetical protein
MRIITVTGAMPRDYLEVFPEDMQDLANLLAISQSKFIPEGTLELYLQYNAASGDSKATLRIFFGEPRERKVDPLTRAELDATP